MIFEQYYLACLSHASYLIGDQTSGRAVVVDPQRDISQYLADAQAAGLTIERVIETHFHADFLSGHLELQGATGAVISYGSVAEPSAEFAIEGLANGQRLSLGEVTLEIRHTPGHTPESISIVVYEHPSDAVPYGVLTGDTLFIGDVGRPDLLTSVGITADELAVQLYHSTREQLLTLPDETRVFPAHGAGSACGKFLSAETSSTIGEQRRTNYALQDMSESEFVHVVTEGQSLSPLYFAFAANRNKQSRAVLSESEGPVQLTMTQVLAEQRRGAVVLDTRDPAVFAQGHLVGVRGPGEVVGGKLAAAREVPLPRILDRLGELDPTAPTVVYCAGGYRSMIAASVMRASGFRDVSDLIGGYVAWDAAGLTTVAPAVVGAGES